MMPFYKCSVSIFGMNLVKNASGYKKNKIIYPRGIHRHTERSFFYLNRPVAAPERSTGSRTVFSKP